MPRDGSGNYTLPSGNPVVTNTTIQSSWANATMGDIAVALTDSLSRSGNGGMLAPLGFSDGTALNPGIFFNNQPNMGMFRVGAGELGFSVGGVSQINVTGTTVTVRMNFEATNIEADAITAGSGGIESEGAITSEDVIHAQGGLRSGSGSAATLRFANNDWISFDDGPNLFLFTSDVTDPFEATDNTTIQTGRLRLTSTSDAYPSSTAHGFQVGPDTGDNLIADNNEIMFRNNGNTVLSIFSGGTITKGGDGGAFNRVAITDVGADSGLKVADFTNTQRHGGHLPSFRSVSGNITLTAADANGTLLHTGGSGTITIPPNSGVAYPLGTVINMFTSSASGNRTLAGGAGVTLSWPQGGALSSGNRTIAAASAVSVIKTATNLWRLVGNGIS